MRKNTPLPNRPLQASGTLLLLGALACVSDPQQIVEDTSDAASVGTGGANGNGGATAGSDPRTNGGAVSTGGGSHVAGATGTGGMLGAGGAKSSVPILGFDAGIPSGMGGGTGSGTGGLTGAGGGNPVVDGAVTTGTPVDVAPESSHPDASPPDRSSNSDVPVVGADVGGTDGLSAAAQEYVKTFAEPYCTLVAECCAQQDLPFSGLGPCEAHELLFVKYLDDGSEVMNPDAIQTILTQLQSSCDQPSYALLASTTRGTRTPGQPCVAVDQCAGEPALCLFSAGTTNGTCVTPPRGTAGDGCSVTCDDATLCKWGTSGGKSPYSACYEEDGLRCDAKTETCVPLTAPGEKCTDFTECGTHADCREGICQAMAPLGADCGNGRSCDRMLQCMSNADSSYTCQKMSVAWRGSCSP